MPTAVNYASLATKSVINCQEMSRSRTEIFYWNFPALVSICAVDIWRALNEDGLIVVFSNSLHFNSCILWHISHLFYLICH